MHDVAVVFEATASDRGLQLGQIEPRLGDRNARADIDPFGDLGRKVFGNEMTPGIERYDLLGIGPLSERPDDSSGMGVCEVGTLQRIKRAG